MATATLTQEACEKCYRPGKLEISITGRERLCKGCMIEQFEYYKQQRLQYCGEIEKLAEYYRRKVESFSPVIVANLQQINQVADQIEESYASAINLLNKQKMELTTILNDCRKDNTKFNDFKNQLNVVLANMQAFKDPAANLYDDYAVKNLVTKFEQSFQLSQTIEKNFQSLINQPVRSIDRYERGPSLAPNKKYLGKLFIMDNASVSSLPTAPVPVATMSPAPVSSAGDAAGVAPSTSSANLRNSTGPRSTTEAAARESSAALQHLALAEREQNYEKWVKKTNETPYMIANFDKEPSFVTSYRNLIFVVNPKSELTLISISNNIELKVGDTYQIDMPNIRSIGVNANFFAISYTDLDKKTMQRKNYKKNGINLYERTSDFVDFNLERKFELDTGEFVYPVGISLDADFIYICDKGLKAVIKMNIMNGNTVARVDFPAKGYPYKLAVNRNFLVVTDPAQHLLNVYDSRTLRFVRNLCVEQPKAKNGPFSVYLTDDNTIFFKNYPDSQLTIVDINLNKHMVFSQITTSIEGFTVAECFNNQKVLIIGSTIKNKEYKLITYFIN